MEIVNITVNELRHIFSVFIAELLLVLPSTEKRDKFVLRMVLCVAAGIILSPVYALFYVYLHDSMVLISVLWYTFIAIAVGAAVALCFKINFTSLVWVMIAAYAVEHFVYVLISEIVLIGLAEYSLFQDQNVIVFWIMLSVYAVVCTGVYYAFYRIFKPNINYLGNYYLRDNWKNRIFFSVFMAVFFASTLLNQQNAQNSGDSFNFLGAISDLINCLFVLIVQFVGLTTSRINFEKQFSEKLYKEEQRQYETFKNSVDYVNIKCHDLKHELQRIQSGGKMNVEKLGEITDGVAIYEAFAKTGNETLDILLTEKNLACISRSISLTYMADASELKVMSESDIYSLFGNLLDNAIEYVENLSDEEKKFIRLFIKPHGDMLLIHEENYFEGDLQLVGGMPKTTKSDKNYHGFGVSSMRRTAQKYGGDLKIDTADGLFKVDIFIQIQ